MKALFGPVKDEETAVRGEGHALRAMLLCACYGAALLLAVAFSPAVGFVRLDAPEHRFAVVEQTPSRF